MKSSVVKQDKSNSNKTDDITKGATFEDIIKYMVSDKVTSANMAKKKAKKHTKKVIRMNTGEIQEKPSVVIDVTTMDMVGEILDTLYRKTSYAKKICYTPEQIFNAINKPEKYTIEAITTICDYLYRKGHCLCEFKNKGEFIGWSFYWVVIL